MLLRIQVKPGSKVDAFFMENEILKAKIKAPPVEGKANAYLTEMLANKLGLPKSKVTLLKGDTSKFKTFEIETEEEVLPKLLDQKIGFR
jgi:uncharacterized protein